MGGVLTSRRNPGVEEVDISNTNAYRYPPKSGSYSDGRDAIYGSDTDFKV